MNHGHQCEFDFTRDGKLNVSLITLDWINTEFDQLGRENIICTKSLVFYQKRNMKWKKLKKSSNILKAKELIVGKRLTN